MKKFLFIALFLGIYVMAVAQPRAIGARLGYNFEVSYQHTLGKNFVELDAGLVGYGRGIQLTGIYDFVIATPKWTSKGEWNFYAGPGASVGYLWHDWWGGHSYNYYYDNWPSAAILGVAGQVGLEYTFDFDLQLSFDYRPFLGVAIGKVAGKWNPNTGEYGKVRFYTAGFYDFALSIRYRF